jgi:hypothetical protein
MVLNGPPVPRPNLGEVCFIVGWIRQVCLRTSAGRHSWACSRSRSSGDRSKGFIASPPYPPRPNIERKSMLPVLRARSSEH